MVSIRDEHVEWAIVNRLKAMLEERPQTSFDVTRTFALFSSVLMWSKQRAWVAGRKGVLEPDADENDHLAHGAREALGQDRITDAPWLLSTTDPQISVLGGEPVQVPGGARINSDFENMSPEAFFKWLRDAIAHGDGRTITPIHKRSMRTETPLLAGFRFRPKGPTGSPPKELFLYHDDMRRLGIELASLFCRSLSGGNPYFEQEARTVLSRRPRTRLRTGAVSLRVESP